MEGGGKWAVSSYFLPNLLSCVSHSSGRDNTMDFTAEELSYIATQIFLPPKLPHKEEHDRRNKDSALSRFISSVADEFRGLLNQSGDQGDKKSDQIWKTICRMLKAAHLIHGSSHLDKKQVNNAFKEMEINDVIPIYIAAQNAAVIFRKPSKEHLTFEFFEVSLPNHVVMSTAGKIVVQYPANSRLLVNNDEDILSTISNILSFLNTTTEAAPKTPRIHDTVSPSYITEALAGILRAVSPPPSDKISTTYIQKRIDDHVLGSSKFERLAQVLESLAFKRLGQALVTSEFQGLEQSLHASEFEDLVQALKSSGFKQKSNVFWSSDFEGLKQVLGSSELLRLTQLNAQAHGSSEFESLRQVFTYSEYEHLKGILGFLELRRLKQSFRSTRFGPLKEALESSEFVRLAQLLGSTEFERLEQALASPEFERLAQVLGSSQLDRLEKIFFSSGFVRLRQALESSGFESLKEAPEPSMFERLRYALESGLEKFKQSLDLRPERPKKQTPRPSGHKLLRQAMQAPAFEHLEQALGASEYERLERVLGSSELERLERILRSSGFKRLKQALGSSEFENLKQFLGSSELLRLEQLLGSSEFERLRQVLGPSDFVRLRQVLGSSEVGHLEQVFHSPESQRPKNSLKSLEFESLKQVLESSEFGNVKQVLGSPRFDILSLFLRIEQDDVLHSAESEGLKQVFRSSEFESLKQVLEASDFERLAEDFRSSDFESLERLLQSSGLESLVLPPSEFERLEQVLRSSKPKNSEQALRALESKCLKRVLQTRRFQEFIPILQSSETDTLKPVLQSSGFESLEQILVSSEFQRLERVLGSSTFRHLEQVHWALEFESLEQVLEPSEFEHLKQLLGSSDFIGFNQIHRFSGFRHLKQALRSSELEWRGRSFRPSELEGLKQALEPSDFKRLEEVLQFSEFERWGKVIPSSIYKPWRRSPMWLVLRVAIQSTLSEAGVRDEDGYKAFQVFAMSKLLDQVTSRNEAIVSSDIIYLMNAKLARRLVKLKELVETKTSNPINTARETVHRVASLLDQRWQETQKSCTSPLDWTAPSWDEIEESLRFSLQNSNGYLRAVMERTQTFSASLSIYNESRKSRELVHACSNRLSHHSPELPRAINTDELAISIYDFETWVELQLPLWSQRLNHTKKEYGTLATILDTYSTYATSHHKDAPELLSVTYLCILELWIALDKIAIKFIPLLSDYTPEIPFYFLEPLLLPRMSQMRRLHQVESYLLARHGAAVDGYSMFGDMNHPQSFQNCFFASSPSLKDLKRRIERLEATRKEATLQKMHRTNQKYVSLTQKLEKMSCTMESDDLDGPSTLHRLHCEQCRLREKVRSLGVIRFEEPLPQDIHHAQALVFEFDCPSVFGIWRDATYRVLRRATTSASVESSKRYTVADYYSDIFKGKNIIKPRRHDLGIASSVSLSKEVLDPLIDEKDVIRKHSGQFELYDFFNEIPLCKTGTNELIRSRCTFQLDGHYQDLQNFISDTSHTSNEVIATRSTCPVSLRISEQDAFGHLRSGNRLQWRNIMRALASSSLSFSEPAVYSLIMQSIWQAGPRGEQQVYREAHAELPDTQFGTEILGELRENLNNLGDNDDKFFFLATLNAIACRLHTLTTSFGVRETALKFLEESRQLALRWIDSIAKEKLQSNGVKAAECRLRSTRAALVYRSSFDLEDSAFPELFNIPKNLTGFIRALIIIPFGVISGQPRSHGLQCLFRRDQQLSYRAEFHVAAAINQNPSALDLAVRSVWPAYISDSLWSPLQAPGTRWWMNKTKKDEKTRPRVVHLNILDGTLLVDAKTIGRLPPAYLEHPSYRLLFPSLLDSRPSTMPGMEYEVDYAGQQIQLLIVDKDLVVRTRGPFGLEEFIPANKLHGDIPLEFEEGRAHWYLEATKEISFRPNTSIWEANPQSHWSMALTKDISVLGRLSKRTLNGIQEVIDPHSIVHKDLTHAIRALEPTSLRTTTFVTREGADHKLHISLSRHNFKFFLNETQELECQNIPNYIIDKDQVRTSLFGLQDALFLRKQVGSGVQRKLLVPKGEIKVTGSLNNHPVIRIDSSASRGIFVFEVDELVGRYIGNYTFSSECFLIRLHALTSSYLPDPLTKRTGTEEALDRLSSAFMISYQTRPKDWKDQLSEIAAITPKRQLDSTHSMETISWKPNLPVTSQHPDFYILGRKILSEWSRIDTVCEGGEVNSYQLSFSTDENLNSRASLRLLGRSALENADHTWDSPHEHRDSSNFQESQEREYLSYKVATAALQGGGLPVCEDLASVASQWNFIAKPGAWGWEDMPCWFSKGAQATWRTFYDLCRINHGSCSTNVIATFALLAYRGYPLPILGTLISVLYSPEIQAADFELHLAYDLQMTRGEIFNRSELRTLLEDKKVDFDSSVESNVKYLRGIVDPEGYEAASKRYYDQVDADVTEIIDSLESQWLTNPPVLRIPRQRRLKMDELFVKINTLMQAWSHNHFFLEHLRALQNAIKGSTFTLPVSFNQYPANHFYKSPSSITKVDLSVLLDTRAPSIPVNTAIWTLEKQELGQSISNDEGNHLLTDLYDRLRSAANNPLEIQYAEDLAASMNALKSDKSSKEFRMKTSSELAQQDEDQRGRFASVMSVVIDQLAGVSLVDKAVEAAGLWPRVTPKILLRRLSLKERKATSASWIHIISHLAELVISVQQTRRLIELEASRRKAEYYNEVNHSRKREQEDDLDWLLIEIDSNMSIRNEQVDIAKAMMKPETGDNAVMQLNMGKGKSSVIVPMVTASLADTTCLVRVLVPKPQAKQQLLLLQSRLSDLSNRSILHITFNRNTPLNTDSAPLILGLMQECQRSGGVWLCQPEQLLSFKLLGLDIVMKKSVHSMGEQLISTQLWLQQNVRDILDESDEILHPRNQLVYTVGEQRLLDTGSARWEMIQRFLDLFGRHLRNEKDASFLVTIFKEPERFPQVRIKSEEAKTIIPVLARQIIWEEEMPPLSFKHVPERFKHAAHKFIIDPDIRDHETDYLRQYCQENGETFIWRGLLLLRGLFALNMLTLVLKESRFRVDYGLDLRRSQLAVPYRAKDSPSLRSNFAHPDVMILLTCLSYYYQGLTSSMIAEMFKQLTESDSPDLIYQQWISSYINDVPPPLRRISWVDMDDEAAIARTLKPVLQYNKKAIDFFLNNCVFPKEAMEFPFKMSTSGWDIAMKKEHLTTGFSGTNDSRFLLPLSIGQYEEPRQRHTNAEVLGKLLQEENSTVIPHGDNLSTEELLELVLNLTPNQPTVFLDVGAQVLDSSNQEFVVAWLKKYDETSHIKAAIFFDEDDQICTITKDGIVQLLQDSPYLNRMDDCLVYLDDIHTRGTDLKLPTCRAAVTLGPKITKDKLVQGCMRMRKLGSEHSVIFLAPHEVISSICKATKCLNGRPKTFNVLLWSVLETCRQLQANIPTWAAQGHEFATRAENWRKIVKREVPMTAQMVAELFCEPEVRSLARLYDPKGRTNLLKQLYSEAASNSISRVIMDRCKILQATSTGGSGIQDEQEYETIEQKEHRKEVKRISDAQPASHFLHPEVKSFVSTGRFNKISNAFLNISKSLAQTSLKIPKGTKSVFKNLFVTVDFAHTVMAGDSSLKGFQDDFLRPVEWVVTPKSNTPGILVLFSPFEVNELLPTFRNSSHANLHLYAPRSSRSMRTLEELLRFTLPMTPSIPVPARLTLRLNLYSGALYLRDYRTYKDVCALLRLHFGALPSQVAESGGVDSSGFVEMAETQEVLGIDGAGFKENPILFLRGLVLLRRHGRGFLPSHMGQILFGLGLREEQFTIEDEPFLVP